MSKVVGFQMTERDVEIVRFVNEFGFCEMYQINQKFNLQKPRNYQVLNRLIEAKLITHERVFFNRSGIYRVTATGAQFSGLPPLAKVPLGNYEHNLMLTDLCIQLCAQYPQAQWVSERQLKFEKYFDGVGKFGHTPDGMLIFPDGKQIAIELELTMKGKFRLEKIVKFYASQFSIKEVWYFCSRNLVNKLRTFTSDYSYVKVMGVDEI